jgi:hypothetical protein
LAKRESSSIPPEQCVITAGVMKPWENKSNKSKEKWFMNATE